MKEIMIRIPNIETAKQFCRMAEGCEFDVDIFYNRVIVDAKSLLGVLGLDFGRELTVRMYGDNEAFEAYCTKLHTAHGAVA